MTLRTVQERRPLPASLFNGLQILSYDIHHLILQFFFLFTIFFVVGKIVPFIGIVLMVVEFFFSITIQDISPVPLFS